MELIRVTAEEFSAVYHEMEQNFILEERRDEDAARALLEEPRYALYHMTDGDTRVGFVSTWDLTDFLFVEHLVTYRAYRKRGYGRQALERLMERGLPTVLEVEPPKTEVAKGRIEFYKKVGFQQNDYPYFQPSYRKGGTGVELILMSWPRPLEDPAAIKSALYETVYQVEGDPI